MEGSDFVQLAVLVLAARVLSRRSALMWLCIFVAIQIAYIVKDMV